MRLLEDILRVLDVVGREAKDIIFDLHELAGSRGARRLVVRLPKKVREELDENIENAMPGKQIEIIQNVVQNHFSRQERQAAYEQALREIIEKEFLSTVLREATEAQRREIQKIVMDE